MAIYYDISFGLYKSKIYYISGVRSLCIKVRCLSLRKPRRDKKPDEEITVETNQQKDNIAINIGKNKDGTIYVQIWDNLKTQYKFTRMEKICLRNICSVLCNYTSPFDF